MKKKLIGLMLGIVLMLSLGAFYALDSVHCELLLLRTEEDENVSDPTAGTHKIIDLTTEGNFANKNSKAVQLRARDDGLGHGGNGIEITFCGGSAADKTFTYKLYGWRRKNGMARMIATGTGTLGTQAVVIYPSGATATSKFWADTLTVTYRWVAPVESSDTTGNNEVASLQFDFTGYEWLYCEITDADGTGTEAGDVSAYYAYF